MGMSRSSSLRFTPFFSSLHTFISNCCNRFGAVISEAVVMRLIEDMFGEMS